jgi:LAO/AO transport system ATPase
MSVDEALLSGDRLVLSRFLTQVENGDPQARPVLDRIYQRSGHALRIGITGAPGTGKSSLVNRLTKFIRTASALTVAIVAVDPSSPFSGGAILGDRVRMRDLAGDKGVFIRSMASRGALGGLAVTTAQLVQALDAAGYDVLLIETVGVGQAEVEITRLAHTTLVVEAPGFGDDIQAIKAGIMEIADILVINKADLPGVENTERALRSALELNQGEGVNLKAGHRPEAPASESASQVQGWQPPILRTVATSDLGIAELWQQIQAHQHYLESSGRRALLEQERLCFELTDLLQSRLMEEWRQPVGRQRIEMAVQQVIEKTRSPEQAVDWLLNAH